jgi:hypothetical protein
METRYGRMKLRTRAVLVYGSGSDLKAKLFHYPLRPSDAKKIIVFVLGLRPRPTYVRLFRATPENLLTINLTDEAPTNLEGDKNRK